MQGRADKEKNKATAYSPEKIHSFFDHQRVDAVYGHM